MKKVTFSADETSIERARLVARSQGETLSSAIRKWLVEYAVQGSHGIEFDSLMKRLRYVDAGRHFTRNEMNER
jgi:hypothetical protein